MSAHGLISRFLYEAAIKYNSPLSSADVIIIKYTLYWQYLTLQKLKYNLNTTQFYVTSKYVTNLTLNTVSITDHCNKKKPTLI